jgi:hypothetical protein
MKFSSNNEAAGFYESCAQSNEKNLERLIYRVSGDPRYLAAHVERIYFCFQHHLNEQLFGAIVDLLIILNGCGQALTQRMITGSKSRLTENQFEALENQVECDSPNVDLLPFNRFSIFTKGLLSVSGMVQLVEDGGEDLHDPLMLARAFIEYSQLENATRILEQAIFAQPERMELHDELILLYRSTRNEIGFDLFYEVLSRKNMKLSSKWSQLNDFFKGSH